MCGPKYSWPLVLTDKSGCRTLNLGVSLNLPIKRRQMFALTQPRSAAPLNWININVLQFTWVVWMSLVQYQYGISHYNNDGIVLGYNHIMWLLMFYFCFIYFNFFFNNEQIMHSEKNLLNVEKDCKKRQNKIANRHSWYSSLKWRECQIFF